MHAEGRQPHEANYLKLDCSKARTLLGWKPHWDIKTAVEKIVEFAKSDTEKEQITGINRQLTEYFKE
jgi:CDP-glucose 4,6-dehydratase